MVDLMEDLAHQRISFRASGICFGIFHAEYYDTHCVFVFSPKRALKSGRPDTGQTTDNH
jgi:hypothetical protein